MGGHPPNGLTAQQNLVNVTFLRLFLENLPQQTNKNRHLVYELYWKGKPLLISPSMKGVWSATIKDGHAAVGPWIGIIDLENGIIDCAAEEPEYED